MKLIKLVDGYVVIETYNAQQTRWSGVRAVLLSINWKTQDEVTKQLTAHCTIERTTMFSRN